VSSVPKRIEETLISIKSVTSCLNVTILRRWSYIAPEISDIVEISQFALSDSNSTCL
jgi:hypothetical protein